MGALLLWAACALLLAQLAAAVNEEFVAKLKAARAVTDESLRKLSDEWQIDKYPLFLKSCSMHKSSYELMKLKFVDRMVSAAESKSQKPFVISFLGSSVAAGHDSHFNFSYPVVAGEMLAPAFAAMDVIVDARNMALGNNPCFPYDICVKIFANVDADIVHWEQTYNCGGKPILEQFVRQAMTIPTKPLIVFSESFTAHWAPDKCITPTGSLTSVESELLAALHSNATTPTSGGGSGSGSVSASVSGSGVAKIVSELNKDEFKKAWQNPLGEISHKYRGAGIQTFTHTSHAPYACQGPYIREWEKGAAAWHPSIIAHRLRAAHHAYFWLHAWRDALVDLQALASHRPLEDVGKTTAHKMSVVHTPLPERIHKSPVSEDVKCYSDYEPRGIREASLKAAVVSGLAAEQPRGGWKSIIYENLVHENLVRSALKAGYKDFKHLLFAEGKDAGPLSVHIKPQKEGAMFVCETPGIWGALPEGFEHLWDAKPTFHLTTNVPSANAELQKFVFAADKAKLLEVEHTKELEICMQIKGDVPAGDHVLTITPTAASKIILAWIIVP